MPAEIQCDEILLWWFSDGTSSALKLTVYKVKDCDDGHSLPLKL